MSEPLKGGFAGFAGGSAFKPLGATGTTGATPNLFGSATPAANAGAPTPAAGTPNAFGGGGNLFGAKPANNALFGGGAAAGTTGTNPAPVSAFGGGGSLFGAKPTEGIANTSTPTNPPPAFGGSNLFGTKPAETAAATPAGAGATPAPAFGGGGLFGAKPAAPNPAAATPATTSTPVPGGSLFGGDKTTPAATTSAFGSAFGAKPADTANAGAPKPGLFGNTAATTANASQPTTTPAPAATGFFAKPPEASSSTPAATPAFGGGNLFGKKPDAPAGTPAATTTTTPAVPSLFGAKKDDAADKNNPATSATPSLGTGLFGAKPAENKDGEKKDNAATTPSPFGATATAAPSTTPNLSVPPPSMLRGKTIEEIVNKWSTDLETHVKEFSRLAGEIAVWDRTLIDNGNTIAALLQHVLLAEREQADIEQSLKHVEDQQKELASTLEVYEKAAGEIFDGQGSGLRALDVGPADAERDKHYTLATDLNANLDDLQRSLMQMIESVNELSESPEDAVEGTQSKGDNPLEQIAQILSSHLESLQWVDGAVREVDSKVTEVERLIKEASSGSRISGNSPFSNSVGPNGSTKSRGFGFR